MGIFSNYGTDSSQKDRIMALAAYEATKYSITTILFAGGLTALATWKSKSFRTYTNISAKVAGPTMAGLGVFSYRFEMVQYDAQINPEKWGLDEASLERGGKIILADKGIKSSRKTMPLHHKVLNYMYDHPFGMVAGLGFPFAGYILKQNLKLKHLTLSQKIMHSRVFAQAGVLTILLTTMAFRGYMDENGRFPDPAEEEELSAKREAEKDSKQSKDDSSSLEVINEMHDMNDRRTKK